jgi:hypothetical protein
MLELPNQSYYRQPPEPNNTLGGPELTLVLSHRTVVSCALKSYDQLHGRFASCIAQRSQFSCPVTETPGVGAFVRKSRLCQFPTTNSNEWIPSKSTLQR